MKRLVVFSLMLAFTSFATASPTSAFQAYHNGNYTAAKQQIIELADKGNKEALYYLATMTLNGYDIAKNPRKGITLMKQSAKLNFLPALMYMGKYNFYKKNNIVNAIPWFRQAAYAGNLNAQLFLIIAYSNGISVKKNYDKARWSILQAAKRGNAMAQYELGQMFLESRHKTSRTLGKIWLRKSAQKGFAKAIQAVNDPNLNLRVSKYTKKKNKDDTNKVAENNANTVSDFDKMANALKGAKATLTDSIPITAKVGEYTSTPKIMRLTNKMVLQPDYKLLEPNAIPISKISIKMLQLHYVNQDPKLTFPEYKFTLPHGTKDYTQARQKLLKRATFGDGSVFYKLGQIYDKGLGVKKDYRKSFDYFLKAAKQNYLRAQYEVGIAYLQGKGVTTNTEFAIFWLADAALRGSTHAQFVLGTIYEFGINQPGEKGYIKRNINQAKALFSISAHYGVPDSQYRLAQIYSNGSVNQTGDQSVERRNHKLAYELYRLAANKGIEDAKLGLAYYYAVYSKNKEQLKESFQIAHQEAKTDNQSALLLLAMLYDRGIGTSKSTGNAIDICEKLAEKGNAIAQFMLGTYEYTEEEDKEKAVHWLEKSAQKGNPYAQYNLAILAHKNELNKVGEDFETLLLKSARNNFSPANILLADHYLMQNSDASQVRHAVKIYQDLSAKQNSQAQLKLGFMYANGIYFTKDLKKSFEWYQMSANNENKIAQYLLAKMYQTGIGVKQNIDRAIYYYTKSASANYIPAEVALGYIYDMHKYNYLEALKWYSEAANKGNVYAMYNIGVMYEYGKGIKANRSEAFDWIERAAEKGYKKAELKLADMYLAGIGVSKSPKNAFEIYKKMAAKSNRASSFYQLALMCEAGVGCKQNFNEAKGFYQKAATLGSTKALLALARLNKNNPDEQIRYYREASKSNIPYVKYKLSSLTKTPDVKNAKKTKNKSAKNTKKKSTSAKYCVSKVKIEKKSFFNKVSKVFASTPRRSYMHALNSLNNGHIDKGAHELSTIIKENPDYSAAKESLTYYTCPAPVVVSNTTTIPSTTPSKSKKIKQ